MCTSDKGGDVDKWRIDLENRKVYVTAGMSHGEVLETLKKTGKEAEYVGEVDE